MSSPVRWIPFVASNFWFLMPRVWMAWMHRVPWVCWNFRARPGVVVFGWLVGWFVCLFVCFLFCWKGWERVGKGPLWCVVMAKIVGWGGAWKSIDSVYAPRIVLPAFQISHEMMSIENELMLLVWNDIKYILQPKALPKFEFPPPTLLSLNNVWDSWGRGWVDDCIRFNSNLENSDLECEAAGIYLSPS